MWGWDEVVAKEVGREAVTCKPEINKWDFIYVFGKMRKHDVWARFLWTSRSKKTLFDQLKPNEHVKTRFWSISDSNQTVFWFQFSTQFRNCEFAQLTQFIFLSAGRKIAKNCRSKIVKNCEKTIFVSRSQPENHNFSKFSAIAIWFWKWDRNFATSTIWV